MSNVFYKLTNNLGIVKIKCEKATKENCAYYKEVANLFIKTGADFYDRPFILNSGILFDNEKDAIYAAGLRALNKIKELKRKLEYIESSLNYLGVKIIDGEIKIITP